MMLLALFVTVCCTLASSVNSVSVAPGDIDQTCRNEPGRKSVPKNQKVLLDTQDYRETTLLNIEGSRIWKSIDFDGKSTDSLPKVSFFFANHMLTSLYYICYIKSFAVER